MFPDVSVALLKRVLSVACARDGQGNWEMCRDDYQQLFGQIVNSELLPTLSADFYSPVLFT